jgi:hypothetical protein
MPEVKRNPFGTASLVMDADTFGGDAAIGPFAFTPGKRFGSEPHELFHSGFQQLPGGAGMLIDALLSKASDFGYGGQAAYRNPSERAAYGYQKAVTGVPDEGFDSSSDPAMVAALPQSDPRMIIRNLLDVLGDAAERGGRFMGRR